MGTVVTDKVYYYSYSDNAYAQIVADITNAWDWTNVTTYRDGTMFSIDAEHKIGLTVYKTNDYSSLGIRFNTTNYHLAGTDSYSTLLVKTEKVGDNALIISVWRNSQGGTVSPELCDKYIICKAVNHDTDAEEAVVIYLGSNSTSGGNKCMMLASDVFQPVDMAVQNSNANVNAKSTNLIPFYSPASSFITTEVYQSLCENVSSWYFGDVMINNRAYRMSGSVFALDT